MNSRPSQHIDAAIFDGSQMAKLGVWVKRFVAFGLIALVLVGTYVQAAGGWFAPSIQPVAVAIGWQAIAMVAQFALRSQWQSVWYFGAVAFSAAPSVLTYGALMVPQWDRALTEAGAWIAITLIILAADIIPEQILVRHQGGARR